MKMVNNRYLFVFILLFFFIACDKGDLKSDERVFQDVLQEALLKHDLQSSSFKNGVVVIEDSSYVLDKTMRLIKENIEAVSKGDESRASLINKFLSNRESSIYPDFKMENIKSKKSVKTDENLLGVLKLSKVIFSQQDSSKALFFYEFICGPECGSGNLVFVRKEKARWEIDEMYPLYVM